MRVKFKCDTERELFFDSLRKGFNNWLELCNFLEINRNTLLRYKKGESLIPVETFEILKKYSNLKNLDRKVVFFESNWGQKLGGINNYKKNKWVYELGRKKTIELHKQKDNEILNLDLSSPRLAEFVGILIGDGFIGKYGRHRIIQITGNKTSEKEYYKEYLIPLVKEIFGANVYFYERESCIRLSVYSKIVFNTLKKLFEFPVGKKEDITISENLLLTDDCKVGLIRGLFDTDGCISLQRGKYPVIDICTTSKKLSKQIQNILNEFGFGAYICRCFGKGNHKTSYRVTIFGKRKVLKWKDLIGSSNPSKMKRINASVAQLVRARVL